MSNPRFSPITSDLLACKGDAAPSAIKPSLFWRRPPLAEPSRDLRAHEISRDLRAHETSRDLRAHDVSRDLRMVPHELARELHAAMPEQYDFHSHDHEPMPAGVVPPMVPPDGPRPHKMMVTLTHGDYEKLGIAAVKKGITRQQMLRVAVDLHIERLKREFGGCGCMAMGAGNCGEGCGAA